MEDVNVNIKVAEEQHKLIDAAAKKVGLTVGPYMRLAALKLAELETQPTQVKTDG